MNRVHSKIVLLPVLGFLLAFPLGADRLFSPFYVDLFTKILIFGIVLVGYDLLAGYTGLVSLGHALFFGVGGYSAAYTMKYLSTNLLPVLAIALACAVVLGLLVGYFSTQTKDIYFVFLTLAFAQFFYLAAFNLTHLTGGDNGMSLPKLTFGMPKVWEVVVSRPGGFYYLALAILVIAYLYCRRVISSPFGRLLVGIRENDERMGFLGYNTRLLKIRSFLMSAALAVVAGALFGAYQNFVSPGMLHWSTSGDFILMSVLGGMGTLLGPVLGGAIVHLLGDELSSFTQHWMIFFGGFFVLVILIAPKGILGLLEKARGGRRNAS